MIRRFVREGQLYQGSKSLKVPPVSRRCNVNATDKAQYKPGEPAEYTRRGHGQRRQAVRAARISAWAWWTRRSTRFAATRCRTSCAFFFGASTTSCRTGASLNYYFNGEAGKRRMQLAELRPPSRLAQLKPERLVQPKVRKAFPGHGVLGGGPA